MTPRHKDMQVKYDFYSDSLSVIGFISGDLFLRACIMVISVKNCSSHDYSFSLPFDHCTRMETLGRKNLHLFLESDELAMNGFIWLLFYKMDGVSSYFERTRIVYSSM